MGPVLFFIGLAVTPRPRGWAAQARHSGNTAIGCPAHTGIGLTGNPFPEIRTGLPRACGDGPSIRTEPSVFSEVTPRRRGWASRKAALWLKVVGYPARGDGPSFGIT